MGDIITLLRKRGEKHFNIDAALSGRLARKWVDNFRVIVKIVPPRVAACLLKAGLHGWVTAHRFGQGPIPCYLCNRENDSLGHICNCTVVRHVWRKILPLVSFDVKELVGFVDRTLNVRDRTFTCCILFCVHEAHRYWKHSSRHGYTVAQAARSVLLHAAGALHGSRHSQVRDFIACCTHALHN